jgi:hypothetical protein
MAWCATLAGRRKESVVVVEVAEFVVEVVLVMEVVEVVEVMEVVVESEPANNTARGQASSMRSMAHGGWASHSPT